MNSENYILTYDVGTTAIKLNLFDRDLTIMYSDSTPVETIESETFPYQRAEDWWGGVKSLTEEMMESEEISPGDIAAVSSTGQMENCFLVDRSGSPLTRVYLYSDGRAEDQFRDLQDRFGRDQLENMTGKNFDPLMSINKYLWLKENRPGKFSDHDHLITGSKDYINFKLTGKNLTDFTNASTTGFLDFRNMERNRELINELGLDSGKLPEIKSATEVIGEVTQNAGNDLGLNPGTPVINGTGDLGASTLGSGVLSGSGIYCYLGTTGWLAKTEIEVLDNPNIFSLSSIEGEGFIVAGAVLNAGSAYDWFLDKVMGIHNPEDQDYRKIEKELRESSNQGGEPIFVPFLQGERSPFRVNEGNGTFVNLDQSSDRYSMLKATLEGVGFSLKHNLIEILGGKSQLINSDRPISLIGGGSKSSVWPQLLSNILETRVDVLDLDAEAPSLGAALMAKKGLGEISDYSEFQGLFDAEKSFLPEEGKLNNYREKFEKYLGFVETFKNGDLDI